MATICRGSGGCAMWYCKQELDQHHSITSAMQATLWLQICAAGAAVALRMMTCTCEGFEALPRGRYMADLVIALLQDYAAATALFPLRPAELDDAHRDLPEPALLGDWDNAPASCVHGGPLHLAALHNTVPLTLSVNPSAHALICMESPHCLQEICTADGEGIGSRPSTLLLC